MVIKKESIEDGAQTASPERRRALRKIAAGLGTLAGYSVLPEQWTRPVISHVVLPAHAETSGEFPPRSWINPSDTAGSLQFTTPLAGQRLCDNTG